MKASISRDTKHSTIVDVGMVSSFEFSGSVLGESSINNEANIDGGYSSKSSGREIVVTGKHSGSRGEMSTRFWKSELIRIPFGIENKLYLVIPRDFKCCFVENRRSISIYKPYQLH